MALPSCTRCGKRDPQRMHGLTTLWFGPLVELEPDHGYFYLCPECHDELIVPELERIQNRILELHPAAQRHMEAAEAEEAEETEEAEAAEAAEEAEEAEETEEEVTDAEGEGEGEA